MLVVLSLVVAAFLTIVIYKLATIGIDKFSSTNTSESEQKEIAENHFVVGVFHSSQHADFPIIVCLVHCQSTEENNKVTERMRKHATFFQDGGRGRPASAILELAEKPIHLEAERLSEFDFASFMEAWEFADYSIEVIERNQPKERPED